MHQLTPYAIALFVTAILNLSVAVLLWPNRNKPSGIWLFYLLLSTAAWSLFFGLEVAVVDPALKITFAKCQYFAIPLAPVLVLFFVMEYTYQDRWLTPFAKLSILLVPIITIVIAWTNGYHHLLWSAIHPNPNIPYLLVYEHGNWFYFLLSFMYICFSTAFLTLLITAFRFHSILRQQVLALMGTMPLAIMGNIIYLLGPDSLSGFDFTPFSFTFFSLILTWSYYKLQLINLTPIARDRIMDIVHSCLIVLDTQQRIVDLNQHACQLINQILPTNEPLTNNHLIGRSLQDIAAEFPQFLNILTIEPDQKCEISLVLDNHQKHYEGHRVPLHDRRGRLSGQMLMLYDITNYQQVVEAERKARQLSEAMHEISMALNATLEFDQILRLILEHIKHIISFDSSSILILEGEKMYVKAGSGGFIDNNIDTCLPLAGSPNELVMQARHPIRFANVQQQFAIFRQPPHNTIHSILCIPLISRGQTVGFLSLDSSDPDHFSQEDENIATTLATQISIAIEKAHLFEKVTQLAITDALTGLYNRRHFFDLALTEYHRSQRYHNALSILMIDIDDFKRVNDTYGHLIGDKVLQKIAKLCAQSLRVVDIIGRYGGEEFVILMPETDNKQAAIAAERLRQSIAAANVETEKGTINITVSIGAASLQKKHTSMDDLLNCADQSLYNAKQNGRNRISICEN